MAKRHHTIILIPHAHAKLRKWQVTNLQASLAIYLGVFWKIGLIAFGIGVFLLVLSPLIKKWMHGVQ